MIKSFSIKHFRGFDQFELDTLKPINLIGGLNNVGKTSLLEAIFIHAGFGNAALPVHTNFIRGLLPTSTSALTAVQDFLGASFYRYEVLTPFVLESIDEVGKKRKTTVTAATQWETKVTSTIESESNLGQQRMGLTLNLGKLIFEEEGTNPQEHSILLKQDVRGGIGITIEPNPKPPSYPCHFLTTHQQYIHAQDAAIYSSLRQEGKDALILEGLKAIDPSIEGIEILTPGGTPIMNARRSVGIKLLPIPLLGDGAVRLVNYILKIAQSSLGIVLIDEFGFDFHYTVLPQVWEVMYKASKLFGTQIICNTHSFEIVEAAYSNFVNKGVINDFQYVRLEKTKGDQVKGIVYDKESLPLAIENRFEVR
jgi:hypothetical protein